ncbi:MAG: type II toxin-antitoxin system VapC family toxin [Aphanocapsa sp. GSE-SYN-MK-11-07L]|nr:type II toxin-antitoxin system VapC family toxin [Aphanocapsa sp. GSE-SYN-MK-11-07L]
MKGLDANVLLRYLIQDDQQQWQKAAAYINSGIESGEIFFINSIVLCECVWVLQRAYKLSRDEVVLALEQILSGSQFQFEDKAILHGCIQQMKAGSADFADYLLGKLNQQAGCTETATFDCKLRASGNFKLL